MHIIARVHSDYSCKFGIPRQSGIIKEVQGKIVFEKAFRNPDILRGLEEFSHLWLIWQFSEHINNTWSPTVRPPRLGGNQRVGVFASRAPFRPNPIGLSVVRLENIVLHSPDGPLIYVSGLDLLDNTPLFDLKPYIPYTDSITDATGGYAAQTPTSPLTVNIPQELLKQIPEEKQQTLYALLAHDPRPSYKNNTEKNVTQIYRFEFAGLHIAFTVQQTQLTVQTITKMSTKKI